MVKWLLGWFLAAASARGIQLDPEVVRVDRPAVVQVVQHVLAAEYPQVSREGCATVLRGTITV